MKWLKKKNNNFTHLMSFPIDSPFFPNNLVSKFLVYKDKYEIISANSEIEIIQYFRYGILNLRKN